MQGTPRNVPGYTRVCIEADIAHLMYREGRGIVWATVGRQKCEHIEYVSFLFKFHSRSSGVRKPLCIVECDGSFEVRTKNNGTRPAPSPVWNSKANATYTAVVVQESIKNKGKCTAAVVALLVKKADT